MTENNSTTVNELYREIDVLLQDIQRYYSPILVLLGLLGNCLSVCVFFGTKLRYSSSSIYLGALAISDSGFLMVVFVSWLKMVYVDLFNRQGFCQFFIYFATLCSFLSVWFVVSFTVERYIAVRWPLRRQFLCTVARAKMTVMGLTVLAILLSSPVLLFSKLDKNSTICGHIDKDWMSWAIAYNTLDIVMTFAVPLTTIVIFNTLIARNVYKLDHVRRTLTIESDVSNERIHTPRDRMPQTKVTKMLLVVSSAFFCLNMPAFVLRVLAYLYAYLYDKPMIWLILAQQMGQLLFNTSFGINFILYCASGQNFRREMFHMCTKRSSTTRSGTLMQMASHGKQCVSEFTRKYSSTKRSHFAENAQRKNSQETQKLSVNKGL
ncbi:PREDICTED: thyrotropin-releasing hormone receptor isoform X1 [Wasmannia auropunctata]|uniref:thyrotropin-releasing hormone receptor isoform X1 n=1 Tax=Wasmannia auropunctata TaxID=64793 RepID=UPI0005F0A544|nr:PREDICTED: thyrotropin-releasing hormone receptor isoform X1 [Wasmannia auropunctata]XP_011700466.1 PREDICTED: thyrotropin-releasing hormone receptor isoform X1 [Wasmannia auropunctata]XP_011700468.1 PREDICTED: thyrotropin-releasing hormone receptor isoform X1 [Wasmannia auropunctata]